MKPIIELSENDFGDILQFPLLWRWNSKKHVEFSPEQLQAIRPLTIQAASKLHAALKHLHQPGGLNPSETYELRKINAEQNEEAMKTWMDDVPIAADEPIVISWNNELAVQTKWEILRESWSDFWYPSSDDLTVIPISSDWALAASHDGLFEWAKTENR